MIHSLSYYEVSQVRGHKDRTDTNLMLCRDCRDLLRKQKNTTVVFDYNPSPSLYHKCELCHWG